MARPFYIYEADDPDLDWLISNFLYERPDFIPLEVGSLPLMLLPYHEEWTKSESSEPEKDGTTS